MNKDPTPASPKLTPFALKDAPALIETIFPARKISFESLTERKAGNSQTLTGLGSYWKGRKPLILARAIVLGCLLPPTGDPEADLGLFEKLMAVDDEGLARRALKKSGFKVGDLAKLADEKERKTCFSGNRWKSGVAEEKKLAIYRRALASLGSYEDKAKNVDRPEEIDQAWLYAPVWEDVNKRYARWGVHANSVFELVEQLGVLRFGRRPKVGDAFCGGGSIPFEAARLGCDAYASDLNPVACMLTWGAFNVVGADPKIRAQMDREKQAVFEKIDQEITRLGVEHDSEGNRAKYFLYCLETRCPETGWMIPLSTTWVIASASGVCAKLVPDEKNKRFNIEVVSGATPAQLKEAEKGTVQDGEMVYALHGKIHRTPIRTLRGDYRDQDGKTANRLRRWEENEFKPRPDDVFQERLYAIQWIRKGAADGKRQETYFASATEADLERERAVERLVAENLAQWQEAGLVPDMAIEPGDKTEEPIRTRGWTYWRHLFNARQLLMQAIAFKAWRHSPAAALGWIHLAKAADLNSKLCRWASGNGIPHGVFSNPALNTLHNYAAHSWGSYGESSFGAANAPLPNAERFVAPAPAAKIDRRCDLWITDPPCADAVNYHEITEYFIAWLRKNPPKPFDEWVWDSRRVMAVKGSGNEFRDGMIAAFKAMASHMPDNGMQCAMLTRQDNSSWADMVGVFWGAGLRVVSAWSADTETSSALKQGRYAQSTVLLMLKKRPQDAKSGHRQLILPLIRSETSKAIEAMTNLNDAVISKGGAPAFNDSDLQMAGCAAALKVLTSYGRIGGEDVAELAARPRAPGEIALADEMIEQAAQTANSLLTPDGMTKENWAKLSGVERFVLRMMDMESRGFNKLEDFQTFAQAFAVKDCSLLMGSVKPYAARLKRIREFDSRDLGESSEFGRSRLGRLTMALQQLVERVDPEAVANQLRLDLPDFLSNRAPMAEVLAFIARKSPEQEVREAAQVLAARLRSMP